VLVRQCHRERGSAVIASFSSHFLRNSSPDAQGIVDERAKIKVTPSWQGAIDRGRTVRVASMRQAQ
jgi:hypothetical protein